MSTDLLNDSWGDELLILGQQQHRGIHRGAGSSLHQSLGSAAGHPPSALTVISFPELSLSPSPVPETRSSRQNSPVGLESPTFSSSSSKYSVEDSLVLTTSSGPFQIQQEQTLLYQQEQNSTEAPPLFSQRLGDRHTFQANQSTLLHNQFQSQSSQFSQSSGETLKCPEEKKLRTGKHRYTTFRNGFAMTFTAEDDYNVVDSTEFDSDVDEEGKPRVPAENSITVNIEKRNRLVTAAASRGRRQLVSTSTGKQVTASATAPRSASSRSSGRAATLASKESSEKTNSNARPQRRQSERSRVMSQKAGAPKYEESDASSHSSDGDHIGGEDEDSEASAEEEEEGEEKQADPLPERVSSAGHSLRARSQLNKPNRLKEYVPTFPVRSNQVNKKKKAETKHKRLPKGVSCKHCKSKRIKCDAKKPKCGNCIKYGVECLARFPLDEDGGNTRGAAKKQAGTTTQREDIRAEIQQGATKRRWIFFRAYEHLFLPLLPERNFIVKLKEKAMEEKLAQSSNEGKDTEGDTCMGEDGDKALNGTETDGNGATETDDKPQAVPYELLEKQPSGVKAIMKPYQLVGLSFLVWLYRNGASGLLGDEMGLGKTLQTLSLFSYLTEHHPSPPGHHRPFLVVCPLSVLSSWMNECKKWTPHLRVMRFHGPVTEKERMKKIAEDGIYDEDGKLSPIDVLVTTYEVFEREVTWFRRAFVWRYVVLDEGHRIKNEMTNIAQALQGLSAEYRLVLTGTPLQNNLKELWALLHFIIPEVFTSNTQSLFSNSFDLTQGKVDRQVMDDSRRLLELIMLRRMKDSKGVNLGLPPKREVVLSLPLTPMQKFWYKRLITRLDQGLLEDLFRGAKDKEEATLEEEKEELLNEEGQLEELAQKLEDEPNSLNGDTKEETWKEAKTIIQQNIQQKGNTGWQKLMNLLMQLRKCCNHPYLLPGAGPEPYFVGQHLIRASSKMILLDRLIDELCIKQGKKVLIFSTFTRMLNILEEFLSLKGGDGDKFRYSRLDGSTCRARRNLEIRLFNTDERYKVMLLSTRAGGLGINLASASDVIMFESDWNPQADLQAQARAHRIGQTQEVTVYRLITQGTVEEQMMGRIRKKLYLSAKVTESMRDFHGAGKGKKKNAKREREEEDASPNLTTAQLMSLVRRGAQAIARPEIDAAEMLTWDWETMLQRTKDYEMTLEPNSEQGKAKKVELEVAMRPEAPEEDLEQKWLSEMEKVETRLFEGRAHRKKEESEAAKLVLDVTRDSRREGKHRVVMVGGHAVLKESMGCGEWEAVPTISGKGETVFSEPKKERHPFEHQDYCQICFDGGLLSCCQGCPRSYHLTCLPESYRVRAKDSRYLITGFYCPQHQCHECEQKTTNAGGMLYRCRWCENAFCEDCIDLDSGVELLGDHLIEFGLLNYPDKGNAYWVKCADCVELHKKNKDYFQMCQDMEKDWEERRAQLDAEEEQRLLEEEERLVRELKERQAAVDSSGADTPSTMTEGLTVGGSTLVTTTAATSVGSDSGGEEPKSLILIPSPLTSEEQEIQMDGNTSVNGKKSRGRPKKQPLLASTQQALPPPPSNETLTAAAQKILPIVAGLKRKESASSLGAEATGDEDVDGEAGSGSGASAVSGRPTKRPKAVATLKGMMRWRA